MANVGRAAGPRDEVIQTAAIMARGLGTRMRRVDEATREKFTELGYLEKSIGRTGLLAIQPMLHMSHKDLWQLYMLGK